jgi:FimV-like protein
MKKIKLYLTNYLFFLERGKMKKLIFYAECFLLTLLFISYSSAQSAEDLIAKGDKLTDEFKDKDALNTYLKADSLFPGKWEINWRISRALTDLANHMPEETGDQKDAQLAQYQKAFDYADKSVKLAPNESVTYLRRAIANGKIALFKGVFSVAGVVNSVKDDCEKAIKINKGEAYDIALAHYVLGRTHAKVSEKWAPARAILGLGWADLETGIKEYKKAVELYPNFRMFYLDLAKAYIRDDNYKDARENLQKVISSPVKYEDDNDYLAEAKKLLEEIKDE